MTAQATGGDLPLWRILAEAGVAWSDLCRSTVEIVLFGSRAAGLAGPASDWDLLCVGSGRSIDVPGLDLVWISPAALHSTSWLTSELAGHVACYGRWLHGDPAWTGAVAISPEAVDRKGRRVVRRLAALERAWPLLAPSHRRSRLTLLRRDLQRHALLAAGRVVPPTALLDAAWSARDDTGDALLALAEDAGLGLSFLRGAVEAIG
jgi:hypothetical protein